MSIREKLLNGPVFAMMLTAASVGSAAIVIPGAAAIAAEGSASPATRAEIRDAGLLVSIDGRAYPVRADVARAETHQVGFENDGSEPNAAGRAAIAAIAKVSPAKGAGRVLIIGGNGDATPAERAGAAGYRHARKVRDMLIAAGWNGDRLVVAGWINGSAAIPGLGRPDRGGTIVIVPLIETARVVGGLEGDPGRALALDSAFSRVATVVPGGRATTDVAAIEAPAEARLPAGETMSAPQRVATPLPSPRPAISSDRPAEPVGRNSIVPTSVAAPAAAPVSTPVPANVASKTEARLPVAPPPMPTRLGRSNGDETTVVAEARVSAAKSVACGGPVDAIDDFYPGGPFRDCAGRRRNLSH